MGNFELDTGIFYGKARIRLADQWTYITIPKAVKELMGIEDGEPLRITLEKIE